MKQNYSVTPSIAFKFMSSFEYDILHYPKGQGSSSFQKEKEREKERSQFKEGGEEVVSGRREGGKLHPVEEGFEESSDQRSDAYSRPFD